MRNAYKRLEVLEERYLSDLLGWAGARLGLSAQEIAMADRLAKLRNQALGHPGADYEQRTERLLEATTLARTWFAAYLASL